MGTLLPLHDPEVPEEDRPGAVGLKGDGPGEGAGRGPLTKAARRWALDLDVSRIFTPLSLTVTLALAVFLLSAPKRAAVKSMSNVCHVSAG